MNSIYTTQTDDLSSSLTFELPAGWAFNLLRYHLYELASLALYRFWARTNIRRLLWSSIVIGGQRLDYTGSAREVFIGFILMFAAFLPLEFLLSGIFYATPPGEAMALAVNLYFVVIFLAQAAARYLALRYQASRTEWCGLCASLGGSAWSYGMRSVAWLGAFALSFGMSVPWACADLARYRARHLRWGDAKLSFSGYASGLFAAWLPVWVLCTLPLYIFFLSEMSEHSWNPTFIYTHIAAVFFSPFAIDAWAGNLLLFALLLMARGLYFVFEIQWRCWIIDNTAIGPVRFRCGMNNVVFRRYLNRGMVGAALYALIAFAIFNLIFAAGSPLHGLSSSVRFWIAVVLIVSAYAGYSFIWMRYLAVPVLGLVVNSTTVSNLADAAEVRQVHEPRQKYGEGLADVLGVA